MVICVVLGDGWWKTLVLALLQSHTNSRHADAGSHRQGAEISREYREQLQVLRASIVPVSAKAQTPAHARTRERRARRHRMPSTHRPSARAGARSSLCPSRPARRWRRDTRRLSTDRTGSRARAGTAPCSTMASYGALPTQPAVSSPTTTLTLSSASAARFVRAARQA